MDGRFAWAIDSNTKHSPRRGRAPVDSYENYEKKTSFTPFDFERRYGSNLCEGKT